MREFLIEQFIKNHDMIKVPSVRTQYGNVASITGVIVNLLV